MVVVNGTLYFSSTKTEAVALKYIDLMKFEKLLEIPVFCILIITGLYSLLFCNLFKITNITNSQISQMEHLIISERI